MVSKNRAERIGDRIREELSEMLIFDIQDPRLSEVSITDVRVDRELAFADIYFSSIHGSDAAEDILAGFWRASGFIRRELANRVELRTFPQLRFHWDPTPEHAENIEQLLEQLSTVDPDDSGAENSGSE
jgi:ribosome-binding factor A